MVRITKALVVSFGTLIRSLCLMLLDASAKAALLFGIVGFVFIINLFHQHPELTDDTLALSVTTVLTSFWAWSRVLVWVTRLSHKYNDSGTDEKTPIGRAITFLAVFILLFLGPTLLIAGFLMSLMHLTASAQIAFSMAKTVAEIDGAVFCIGIVAVLIKGSETVSVHRAAVERVGQGSTSHHFDSFYGFVRQALR